MSQLCRACGEFLNQHKDGKCDLVVARKYRRSQQNRFKRDAMESIGMTRVRVNGKTFYE